MDIIYVRKNNKQQKILAFFNKAINIIVSNYTKNNFFIRVFRYESESEQNKKHLITVKTGGNLHLFDSIAPNLN